MATKLQQANAYAATTVARYQGVDDLVASLVKSFEARADVALKAAERTLDDRDRPAHPRAHDAQRRALLTRKAGALHAQAARDTDRARRARATGRLVVHRADWVDAAFMQEYQDALALASAAGRLEYDDNLGTAALALEGAAGSMAYDEGRSD